MNICIIPARGGSKRIPKKNIRDFCGKPMIGWAIESAVRSEVFDRIVISTDSDEIGEIGALYGAEYLFKRPAYLSDDYTGTLEVIQHAIDAIKVDYQCIDAICCLYPTAAFATAIDIASSRELALRQQFRHVVFSACRYAFPIQRAFSLDKDGLTRPFCEESIEKRSQDLEEFYHDAGQFYWGSLESWQQGFDPFKGGVPYILSRWKAQDIDTEEDWKQAELLHKMTRIEHSRCTE